MAVPPAKGLDEACAWLRKAALTPFPPVTKSEQDYGHGRNRTRTRAKLLRFLSDFGWVSSSRMLQLRPNHKEI